MIHDFCIVGGGIVGLATARALLTARPGASLVMLEKEAGLSHHQTGHNSGVIHSGIYYAPGSLKAELCRRGAVATKAYCREMAIPYEECGKLIVATDAREAGRMEALHQRARANGVAADRMDAASLKMAEPDITGIAALHVPETGIVSYPRICEALAVDIARAGGEIRTGTAVLGIEETGNAVRIATTGESVTAREMVVCAGLQSDRLAQMAGLSPDFRIVPFRGEYYRLDPRWEGRIGHLIYPVPDPDLPFLGIHLTKMIDGSVTVGPNAVLGMAREGYRKLSIDWRDVVSYASFGGFWRMLSANLGSGMAEMRNSMFRRRYLEACRKYCPGLTLDDLHPMEAGIRAQAVMRDGTLVHDFLFLDTARAVFVCNAPSPAATSALPIGGMIAERLLSRTGTRPADLARATA